MNSQAGNFNGACQVENFSGEKMKILLFSHLNQIHEYCIYIKALKREVNLHATLLTMGDEERALGCKAGVFDEVKNILPNEEFVNGSRSNDKKVSGYLKELEERIGCVFVHQDILMDRYFRGEPVLNLGTHDTPVVWTGKRAERFMYCLSRRLEEELVSFRPDFLFMETNSAPYRMAWRLAKQCGIPAGIFMPVRFWPDRIYLETGLGLDWTAVKESYHALDREPLDEAEVSQVEKRLDSIIREKTKPPFMELDYARGTSGLASRFGLERVSKGMRDWLGARSKTYQINPRVLHPKVHSPLAKYKRYHRSVEARRYLQKHVTPFHDFKDDPYAVCFLHVQPELTVEEMAFEYQDQVNTLRNVLAYMPADMSLVVKEHTPMLGHRPKSVYTKLMHMPGIVLADPLSDSHDLIGSATFVITLTGTAALEAVLYGIPAIILGSIFFDSFEGVYKPKNLEELKDLLSDPKQLRGASRKSALKMIGAMLRASVAGKYPGNGIGTQEIDATTAETMAAEIRRARQDAGRSIR